MANLPQVPGHFGFNRAMETPKKSRPQLSQVTRRGCIARTIYTRSRRPARQRFGQLNRADRCRRAGCFVLLIQIAADERERFASAAPDVRAAAPYFQTMPTNSPMSHEQAATVRREQATNDGEPFAAQWLTVAEVADLLGVTPRTIQKRCKAGKLDARSVETPTGEQWEINPASVEKSHTEAANDAANAATNGGEQAANVRSQQAAKSDERAANRSQPQSEGAREYIADRSAAPLDWKERETEFKEQIQWLRNANEQHQRDAIELRQLLKKALEIAPRQLPAAPTDASAAPETAQGNAPTDATTNTATGTDTAAKSPQNTKTRPPKREPRSLIKILLGIR